MAERKAKEQSQAVTDGGGPNHLSRPRPVWADVSSTDRQSRPMRTRQTSGPCSR